MKYASLLFLVVLMALETLAQSEGISPTYTFNIRKKVEPPYLEFVPGSLRFIDEDGNNSINANENCSLEFELKNTGIGDGLNLNSSLQMTGNVTGIQYEEKQAIPNLVKGATQKYNLPLLSGIDTEDGKVTLKLQIKEPNGFNSEETELIVSTKKFAAPLVKVTDFTIFSDDGSTKLSLRRPFKVQLLVQNVGQGSANEIQYQLKHHELCFPLGGDQQVGKITCLKPGETKSLIFEMALNQEYKDNTVDLDLDLNEKFGKYATDWKTTLTLNQAIAKERLVVQAKSENDQIFEVASLRSDVDKDIPIGLAPNNKRYALIIGNEDYSRYQLGLDNEVDAKFAGNDARVFAEYAQKTLGVPQKNITLLLDATKGQMSQQLAQLKRFIEVEKGEAEILFYYSGHGLPEEGSNTPYLIPVDVSGTQPSNGLALPDVYAALATFPAKKVTVILDACFSGGARQKELVAMKGVKVKANVENVPGNLVVLASSSGNEASAVYSEKQHGYFTYFLLKDLKESTGKSSISGTMQRVSQNVAREANRINKKQTPVHLLGPNVINEFEQLVW